MAIPLPIYTLNLSFGTLAKVVQIMLMPFALRAIRKILLYNMNIQIDDGTSDVF